MTSFEVCWCPCACGCRADEGELDADGLCGSCKEGNHEVPPEGVVGTGVPELLALHESIVKQYREVLVKRLIQRKLDREDSHG